MVDQSAVGRSFTPVTAHVEPGRLRYFFNALGERNPIYRDAAVARTNGYSAVPAPPTYLFCLEMMDSDGEQSFVYRAPVVVGDTLTLSSRVASVTDKKGGAMTLIVVETAVTNQDGIHVADVSRTIVVRN